MLKRKFLHHIHGVGGLIVMFLAERNLFKYFIVNTLESIFRSAFDSGKGLTALIRKDLLNGKGRIYMVSLVKVVVADETVHLRS